jgi:hypothetical protein
MKREPCSECDNVYPHCKCRWWACGDFRADHGFFRYILTTPEGAKTTTCPKCGHVDQLFMPIPRIKSLNKAREIK